MRNTESGEVSAAWRIVGYRIAMEMLIDRAATHRCAYRISADGTVYPNSEGDRGTVFFGVDGERPDLVQVREWFPKHGALWDAVRAQYWDVILPLDHPRFVWPGNPPPRSTDGDGSIRMTPLQLVLVLLWCAAVVAFAYWGISADRSQTSSVPDSGWLIAGGCEFHRVPVHNRHRLHGRHRA
ncbi:hypothetical protein [Nocardia jejuensis]|uniref:hypothetical protein n=1 Tax=Nocardia jejuensis TaxID=328049 RepID=UPI0012F97AC3|nr:hypothetical protein [Nocardia jejuensis]